MCPGPLLAATLTYWVGGACLGEVKEEPKQRMGARRHNRRLSRERSGSAGGQGRERFRRQQG